MVEAPTSERVTDMTKTSVLPTVSIKYGQIAGPKPGWVSAEQHPYIVTLEHEGRSMEVGFYCGSACGEPTAEDVLSCLQSDASSLEEADDFFDWCDNLGFDSDRDAMASWIQATAQTAGLRDLLGSDFDGFMKHEFDL